MTISDKVDVFNLAASLVPTRSVIAAVDEASIEAEALELWYDTTLLSLLRAARWPFATKYERLALIKERDFSEDWAFATAPPPDWAFEYACPSDMNRPRYITTWAKFDLQQRDAIKTIATNEVDAILCYTCEETRIHMWDEMFTLAFSHALAANVIMKLTGKRQRSSEMIAIANDLIRQARTTAGNEPDPAYPQELPSWLQIRGNSPYMYTSRFIYPDGPLLSVFNEQ